MAINVKSKIWERNYNLMETKLAKKLIDGRKNAKGKKYSHRPKRYENSWYCQETKSWYRKPDEQG